MLALDAADRFGLAPVSKLRLHRLIFLSNCCAEVYSQLSLSQKIIKYKRGPYYPDVQWHVDRLAAMGLVNIDNLNVEQDQHGPWVTADYSISPMGITFVERAVDSIIGASLKEYLDELVYAFVQVCEMELDGVALKDLNYSQAGIAEGALISFEEPENNKALLKMDEFERATQGLISSLGFRKPRLYMKFIEQAI